MMGVDLLDKSRRNFGANKNILHPNCLICWSSSNCTIGYVYFPYAIFT